MVVGVDIRVLSRREQGGVPAYTRSLLEHLIPLDQSIQYKLFFSGARENIPALPFVYPNVRVYAFRFSNRYLLLSASSGWGPKLDHLIGGVDVWWSPHMLPASLSSGLPRVITAHDLSFVAFPEFLSARRRLWHVLLRPRAQLERAARIIAVSQSTQDDLVRLFRVSPQRISVIHSGVRTPARPPSGDFDKKDAILFLGVLEPRKNLRGLLQAFELCKDYFAKARSPLKRLRLVIAGPVGWRWGALSRLLARSRYRQDCELTGFVSEESKWRLFGRASVFVWPSFLEGFGFPPLEAMAHGVPVVAGANSSLAELLGDSALLIDPWRPSEVAWAMRAILEDEQLRRHLIQRGKARAQRFSWEKCALETLTVLKDAAGLLERPLSV